MGTTLRTRVNALTNVGVLEMYVTDCWSCGVVFAIPNDYDDRRRADGRRFYCPNGHTCCYSETEADRLRKQLERAQREANWRGQDAKYYREQAQASARSAAAYRGHLTRIRKKIAAGICPCCRRTFSNVQRHIAGQHPGFVAKANEALGDDS